MRAAEPQQQAADPARGAAAPDPDLQWQLAELTRRIAQLERVAPDPPTQHTSFKAREGQCIAVEPFAIGLTATLPPASAFNKSKRIQFFQKNANRVTLQCVKGKINGVPFVVSNAPGFFEAISDGETGWTVPQFITASGVINPNAQFVLGASDPSLPNGRVATASVEITPSIAVANVISWALNASSVVFAKLQNLTGLSVLGRAANSAGVMAAITAGASAQYLRSDATGVTLEWGNPASTSVANTAGQFQRAALTGDVTAAQNVNATAFRSFGAKSVLANATNAGAVPSDLAGSAAFQHLRVNSANNGLEWSVLTAGDFPAGTVPLTGLATQASDTFVGNVSGGVASPVAVNLSTLAGAGLVFGTHTLDVTAGAGGSLVVAANDVQRAALTGAVTAAQDSNATAFGTLAAKSVLANATNAVAIPAALAGSAAFQHLRVNSANNALEWSVLTTGDFPNNSVPIAALATIAAKSVLANATNATATPAALAGSGALQHLRVNNGNTGLEWSVFTSGDFPANVVPLSALPAIASNTFLANGSGSTQAPSALTFLDPIVLSTTDLDLNYDTSRHLFLSPNGLIPSHNALAWQKSVHRHYFFDEFEVAAGATIPTAGAFINTGPATWLAQATGTAGTMSLVAGLSKHIGIINVATGATSGNIVTVTRANTITSNVLLGSDVGRIGFLFRMADVANTTIEFGFSNGLIAVDSEFIGMFASAGSVTASCISAGVATSSPAIATITAATWFYWEVRETATGYEFYQNEVLKATITAHLPSGGGAFGFAIRSNSAGAKSVDVDYYYYESKNMTTRF